MALHTYTSCALFEDAALSVGYRVLFDGNGVVAVREDLWSSPRVMGSYTHWLRCGDLLLPIATPIRLTDPSLGDVIRQHQEQS